MFTESLGTESFTEKLWWSAAILSKLTEFEIYANASTVPFPKPNGSLLFLLPCTAKANTVPEGTLGNTWRDFWLSQRNNHIGLWPVEAWDIAKPLTVQRGTMRQKQFSPVCQQRPSWQPPDSEKRPSFFVIHDWGRSLRWQEGQSSLWTQLLGKVNQLCAVSKDSRALQTCACG